MTEFYMKKLSITGIGPGGPEHMTLRAKKSIGEAELVVGYTLYNDLIRADFPEKEYYSTPMKKERERCLYALEAAASGRSTVLICSGDSSVYGMASLVLELAEETGAETEIDVIPGVTAALSAGALSGAAVSGDFAAISLSDLLTPWDVIEKRLEGAASGDFVIALYNPGSKKRKDHLKKACQILRRHRGGETVCAVAEQIGRKGEKIRYLSLEELKNFETDMFMTILIGNSETRLVSLSDGQKKMVTPRGYRVSGRTEKRQDNPEKKLLIFGGTTEGRHLAEYACEKGVPALLCVATKYGESVISPHPLLTIRQEGLEQEQIEEMIRKENFFALIDATHPHAARITEKTAAACSSTGLPYIRVLRDTSDDSAEKCEKPAESAVPDDAADLDITYVSCLEDALRILNDTEGKALVTTGSRDIGKYMKLPGAEKRFIFRVLPSADALEICEKEGVPGKNVICMQGPFSAEMNCCMLKDLGASCLVTKVSGRTGGFGEKLEGARRAGASVIAILPPESRSGVPMEEAMRRIESIAVSYRLNGNSDEQND